MKRSRPLPTIASAGLIAGILDITSAFVIAGLKGVGINSNVAGNRQRFARSAIVRRRNGDSGLGLAIHFLIAFTAATVFYVASRKFSFLTQHAVVSGLLYGIAVYVFMYWIVVPLTFPNVHHSISRDLTAVIIHMVLIGLPIALVVRRFSKEQLVEP